MSKTLNFYSLSNMPKAIVPRSFDHKRKEYRFTLDYEGAKTLSVHREVDIQSEIQAFADDCNIYNLINKYCAGDLSAINRISSSYADLSTTPKNLHEALNLSLKFKADFNNLKPEVRAEFGNDFNKYISAISTGKVFDIFKKFGVKSTYDDSLNEMNQQLDKIKKEVSADDNV